ncbi:MAG: helix-turn-helix transcriptional regulator [Hyphomonadaceae bacterium]
MSQTADAAELLARGVAIGAFLGLALALARGMDSRARLSGILFCLAAAGHTLTQWPLADAVLGVALIPAWIFSVMGAGLFWAFARDLFEDDAPGWKRFAPALVLLAVGIVAVLSPPGVQPFFWLAHNLIGFALASHILFLIAAGWRGDLVEKRRRLRGPVLLAGAAYALAVIIVQTFELVAGSAEQLSPLAAATLMLIALTSVWAFGRVDADLFASTAAPATAVPNTKDASSLDGADTAAAADLDRLMRTERLYREEGLTIAALALRLRLPEHRLRQLINQKLGHRNFSAFVNQWRLEDAKAALADPAQRDVPVSTIALDAGFASLGPFNRAFKADTGLTPSEYRARALV